METKILIVEDSKSQSLFIRSILDKSGFLTDVCYSGEEAFEYLKENNPDIILLDNHMPGLTGIEVLQEINLRGIKIAVILLTGDTNIDTAIKAMRLGALDFIKKDHDLDKELIRIVSKVSNLIKKDKELEEAKKLVVKSEHRYKELISNAPVGILSCKVTGELLTINTEIMRIVETNDPLKLKNINVFTEPKLLMSGISDAVKESLEKQKNIKIEKEFSSSYGKPRFYNIIVSILKINKEIDGFLVIVENITKRKLLELDLLDKKAIAEKNVIELSKSNATRDKLFSIIAHDLKGPIGNNQMIFETLLNEKNLLKKEDFNSLIQEMYRSSKSTYSLLENLLNWGQTQQGKLTSKKESNSLFKVVEDVRDLLLTTLEVKRINLINMLKPDDSIELFDLRMMNTVFRNLISNSIKFTKEEGHIIIKSIGKGIYSVEDNGIGMTEEQIEHLLDEKCFESTYGTKNEKGCGLGFKLVLEFLKEQNISYKIESELGKGTKVILNFNL